MDHEGHEDRKIIKATEEKGSGPFFLFPSLVVLLVTFVIL